MVFFVLYFFAGEMFLIVEYVVIREYETEVEVVPSSWYSSGQCWWPPGAFACSTLEKKFRSQWIVIKLNWTVMTVVSLLLSVRISFIAILRLIFYSHSDFSLQRFQKEFVKCKML